MLRTQHDRIDTNRLVLLIKLDGDLRFAVRTKISHLLSFLADTRECIDQRVRQIQSQRHVVIRLVRRVTEHHALVTRSLLLRVGTTHTHVDIGRLRMQRRQYTATLRFELILRFCVTDIGDRLTGDLLYIYPSFATHLSGDHHLSRRAERLACYVCRSVLR